MNDYGEAFLVLSAEPQEHRERVSSRRPWQRVRVSEGAKTTRKGSLAADDKGSVCSPEDANALRHGSLAPGTLSYSSIYLQLCPSE